MPVPVPVAHTAHALNPSQAANVPQQQQHKARKAQRQHGHHHHRVPKGGVTGLPDQPQMTMMGNRRGARASLVEDENTPFDFAYPNPYKRGVVAPGAGALHVLPQGNGAVNGAHGTHRRSLSSWPPSPQGFPPTPTFDREPPAAAAAASKKHHQQPDEVWPPAPSAAFGLDTAAADDMDIAMAGGEAYSPGAESNDANSNSKIVPSPTELLRIANEQARANAATNLSDWISEAVWEMCQPLMRGYEVSASPSMRRSSSASVPLPFKRFAHQTIYQVSASAGSLMLALWYIRRLPIGAAFTDESVSFTRDEAAFREDLWQLRSEIPWRLLVLGLTLSNKWLEDNTFTTKTWNEVTGLSMASMKSIETKALAIFDWILSPQPAEWLEFLQTLRNREIGSFACHGGEVAQTHGRPTPSAIGSERRNSLTASSPRAGDGSTNGNGKRPIRVIEELMTELRSTVASFDPVFPGVSSNASASETPSSPADAAAHAAVVDSPRGDVPVSPAASVAESEYDEFFESFKSESPGHVSPLYTNAYALPRQHHSRRSSWAETTTSRPVAVPTTRPDSFAFAPSYMSRLQQQHRRVSTPADVWDSTLDEPVLPTSRIRSGRAVYEAVQRPSASASVNAVPALTNSPSDAGSVGSVYSVSAPMSASASLSGSGGSNANALQLIPPPPRFDDYAYAGTVPRARYEELREREDVSIPIRHPNQELLQRMEERRRELQVQQQQYESQQGRGQYEQQYVSAVVPRFSTTGYEQPQPIASDARSWYGTTSGSSSIGFGSQLPLPQHGSSWATTFAGMISSF